MLTGSTLRLSSSNACTTSRIDRPTANPEPPLSLMTWAPAVFVSSKHILRELGVEAGPLLDRQPGDGGARPDRHHAVAVFAEDQGFHLRRRHLQSLAEIALEASRVEHRAQAEDAIRRQAGALDGQVGQHIDRIADDDEIARSP